MSLRRPIYGVAMALALLLPAFACALSDGEVDEHTHTWLSLNSTIRLTERWGMIGDAHLRRSDFVNDPGFYFLRTGANLWITEKLTATLGYAHMWKAPARDDQDTWTDEDRIYQQVQYATKVSSMNFVGRLRNEQRWQERTRDDEVVASRSFTDRVRLLLGLTIPVSSNRAIPSLVISNELLLQFGSGAGGNTFDQNRPFVGIRQILGRWWSFDFGYMPVLVQKSEGDLYDLNHTIRLFFYFTPDFQEGEATHEPAGDSE